MKIAQVLSGYSLGGADILRKAMGKKIESVMLAQAEVFKQGAEDRGRRRFEPATKFDGCRASKVFKLGPERLGYYYDEPPPQSC